MLAPVWRELTLPCARLFTSQRSAIVGGRSLRRADLSEQALEREVRKGLDREGDYTRGELPEQPDMLTHWNVEWSEPQDRPIRNVLWQLLLFFGGLFTIRAIILAYRDFYPLTILREELGNAVDQNGAEYVAKLDADGKLPPGIVKGDDGNYYYDRPASTGGHH